MLVPLLATTAGSTPRRLLAAFFSLSFVLISSFVLLCLPVLGWDADERGVRQDPVNYYQAFEYLGTGWCRNLNLGLERKKKTVSGEAECASLCIQTETCTGFGLQLSLRAECEIYGPNLEKATTLAVPPWTYFADPASRPERGDGILSTECYRKTVNADRTPVEACYPAEPDDSRYFHAKPCVEGISIAEGGTCTLVCNTQAGYVPFPAPPEKAICREGRLVDVTSGQVAGCVTAAQQINLQLLARTTDISWPLDRMRAPLRSWWFDRVDLDLLYSPGRYEVQREFPIVWAEFETRFICNGYEHYPEMAPIARLDPKLILPMHIDLSVEMKHSLQFALQMPNQTVGLQVTSCEFNRTRAMVYLPSPWRNAAQERDFLDTLNGLTANNLQALNAALHHNLRFGRMPNLLEYNNTDGLVFIKSKWEKKECVEDFTYDNYAGCQYQTTTGLRCQTWEQIVPHLHPFASSTYLTTDPLKDLRGFNDLNPYAQAELAAREEARRGSTTMAPETYLGGPTTASPNAPSEFGVTNFDADVQYAGELLQSIPLELNYCRNPDGRNPGSAEKGGSNAIWCFTSNPLLRFDYCASLAVYPVPELCLTQVRGTQEAQQMSTINLAGEVITRNATTVRPFLVPYEELNDEGMDCSDVHPDFDGTIGMYCNPNDLTISFNTHCNDTVFLPIHDKIVDKYVEIAVLDVDSYQDCRKATIDHGLKYFRERPAGFQYQSFISMPVAAGSAEMQLVPTSKQNCLLYQPAVGFRFISKIDEGDVVAVYEINGVPYEWATSPPQFRITGKDDGEGEGSSGTFLLGGGLFLGVVIVYQIYSSCRSGELQGLLLGGDARDSEAKSSGISAFRAVFRHGKLIPFNPELMFAKQKAGSADERAAEAGGLSKEEEVRKFIRDREILEANIAYAAVEKQAAADLKRKQEEEKTKEAISGKLLILRNFFFDGTAWRGYDSTALAAEFVEQGIVDEDRGKIIKKSKKGKKGKLTTIESRLDRRRRFSRYSSRHTLADQEIGLDPHPNQILSVRKAGILMSNMLRQSNGRISGMRIDDEDGTKTELDRRHLHFALSIHGKKALKDMKASVRTHELERGSAWVQKAERAMIVPQDETKQRSSLTPFVAKYYVRKAMDEEDKVLERPPHRVIRKYRLRHQVTQKLRTHLYKKRSFFRSMGWNPLRDEAGTLQLAPERKAAVRSKKDKMKNKGVIQTEIELDAQYTMEMEPQVAQKALSHFVKRNKKKHEEEDAVTESDPETAHAQASSSVRLRKQGSKLSQEDTAAGSTAQADPDGLMPLLSDGSPRSPYSPPHSPQDGHYVQRATNDALLQPIHEEHPQAMRTFEKTEELLTKQRKHGIVISPGTRDPDKELVKTYIRQEKRFRRKAHSVGPGGRLETNGILGTRGVYPWQRPTVSNVRKFRERMRKLFEFERTEAEEKQAAYDRWMARRVKARETENRRPGSAGSGARLKLLDEEKPPEFMPTAVKTKSPLLFWPQLNGSRAQPFRFALRHQGVWVRGVDFQIARDHMSVIHWCDLAGIESWGNPQIASIEHKIMKLQGRRGLPGGVAPPRNDQGAMVSVVSPSGVTMLLSSGGGGGNNSLMMSNMMAPGGSGMPTPMGSGGGGNMMSPIHSSANVFNRGKESVPKTFFGISKDQKLVNNTNATNTGMNPASTVAGSTNGLGGNAGGGLSPSNAAAAAAQAAGGTINSSSQDSLLNTLNGTLITIPTIGNTSTVISSTNYRNPEFELDASDPWAFARFMLWRREDDEGDDSNIVLCKNFRLPPISNHSYWHYGHVCSKERLRGMLAFVDLKPGPVVADQVVSTVVKVLRQRPHMLGGSLLPQLSDNAAVVKKKVYAWDARRQRLVVDRAHLSGMKRFSAKLVHAQRDFIKSHWSVQRFGLSPRGKTMGRLGNLYNRGEDKGSGNRAADFDSFYGQNSIGRRVHGRVATKLNVLVNEEMQFQAMSRALMLSKGLLPETIQEAKLPKWLALPVGSFADEDHDGEKGVVKLPWPGISILVRSARNLRDTSAFDMPDPYVVVTLLPARNRQKPSVRGGGGIGGGGLPLVSPRDVEIASGKKNKNEGSGSSPSGLTFSPSPSGGMPLGLSPGGGFGKLLGVGLNASGSGKLGLVPPSPVASSPRSGGAMTPSSLQSPRPSENSNDAASNDAQHGSTTSSKKTVVNNRGRMGGTRARLRKQQRTHIVTKNALDPEWNAEFDFLYDGEQEILFQVYDHDPIGGDELLGEAKLKAPAFQHGYDGEISLKDPTLEKILRAVTADEARAKVGETGLSMQPKLHIAVAPKKVARVTVSKAEELYDPSWADPSLFGSRTSKGGIGEEDASGDDLDIIKSPSSANSATLSAIAGGGLKKRPSPSSKAKLPQPFVKVFLRQERANLESFEEASRATKTARRLHGCGLLQDDTDWRGFRRLIMSKDAATAWSQSLVVGAAAPSSREASPSPPSGNSPKGSREVSTASRRGDGLSRQNSMTQSSGRSPNVIGGRGAAGGKNNKSTNTSTNSPPNYNSNTSTSNEVQVASQSRELPGARPAAGLRRSPSKEFSRSRSKSRDTAVEVRVDYKMKTPRAVLNGEDCSTSWNWTGDMVWRGEEELLLQVWDKDIQVQRPVLESPPAGVSAMKKNKSSSLPGGVGAALSSPDKNVLGNKHVEFARNTSGTSDRGVGSPLQRGDALHSEECVGECRTFVGNVAGELLLAKRGQQEVCPGRITVKIELIGLDGLPEVDVNSNNEIWNYLGQRTGSKPLFGSRSATREISLDNEEELVETTQSLPPLTLDSLAASPELIERLQRQATEEERRFLSGEVAAGQKNGDVANKSRISSREQLRADFPALASLKWVKSTAVGGSLIKKKKFSALAKSVAKGAKAKLGAGDLEQTGHAACQFIVQKPDQFNRGRIPDIRFDRFPGRSESMPGRLFPQGVDYSRNFFGGLGGKIRRLTHQKVQMEKRELEEKELERQRQKLKLEQEKVAEARNHLALTNSKEPPANLIFTSGNQEQSGGKKPPRPVDNFQKHMTTENFGLRITIKSAKDLDEKKGSDIGANAQFNRMGTVEQNADKSAATSAKMTCDPFVRIYVGKDHYSIGEGGEKSVREAIERKAEDDKSSTILTPSQLKKRSGLGDPEVLVYSSKVIEDSRTPQWGGAKGDRVQVLCKSDIKYVRFQVFDRDPSAVSGSGGHPSSTAALAEQNQKGEKQGPQVEGGNILLGEALVHRGFFHHGFDGSLRLFKRAPVGSNATINMNPVEYECGELKVSILPIGVLQMFVEKGESVYDPRYTGEANPYVEMVVGSSFVAKTAILKNTTNPVWEHDCHLPYDPTQFDDRVELDYEEKAAQPIVNLAVRDKDKEEPIAVTDLRKFHPETDTFQHKLAATRPSGEDAGTVFVELWSIDRPPVVRPQEQKLSEKKYMQMVLALVKDLQKSDMEKKRKRLQEEAEAKLTTDEKAARARAAVMRVKRKASQILDEVTAGFVDEEEFRGDTSRPATGTDGQDASEKRMNVKALKFELQPWHRRTPFARRVVYGYRWPQVRVPKEVRQAWYFGQVGGKLPPFAKHLEFIREVMERELGLEESVSLKQDEEIKGIPRRAIEDNAVETGCPMFHLCNLPIVPSFAQFAFNHVEKFFDVHGEQVRISLPLSKRNALKLPESGVFPSDWDRILPSVYRVQGRKRTYRDQLLTCVVKYARKIYEPNFLGTCDPYVRIHFGGGASHGLESLSLLDEAAREVYQEQDNWLQMDTRVVKNNRKDPEWRQEFKFKVPAQEDMYTQMLAFSIFDSDSTTGLNQGDDFMGHCEIQLESFSRKPFEGCLELRRPVDTLQHTTDTLALTHTTKTQVAGVTFADGSKMPADLPAGKIYLRLSMEPFSQEKLDAYRAKLELEAMKERMGKKDKNRKDFGANKGDDGDPNRKKSAKKDRNKKKRVSGSAASLGATNSDRESVISLDGTSSPGSINPSSRLHAIDSSPAGLSSPGSDGSPMRSSSRSPGGSPPSPTVIQIDDTTNRGAGQVPKPHGFLDGETPIAELLDQRAQFWPGGAIKDRPDGSPRSKLSYSPSRSPRGLSPFDEEDEEEDELHHVNPMLERRNNLQSPESKGKKGLANLAMSAIKRAAHAMRRKGGPGLDSALFMSARDRARHAQESRKMKIAKKKLLKRATTSSGGTGKNNEDSQHLSDGEGHQENESDEFSSLSSDDLEKKSDIFPERPALPHGAPRVFIRRVRYSETQASPAIVLCYAAHLAFEGTKHLTAAEIKERSRKKRIQELEKTGKSALNQILDTDFKTRKRRWQEYGPEAHLFSDSYIQQMQGRFEVLHRARDDVDPNLYRDYARKMQRRARSYKGTREEKEFLEYVLSQETENPEYLAALEAEIARRGGEGMPSELEQALATVMSQGEFKNWGGDRYSLHRELSPHKVVHGRPESATGMSNRDTLTNTLNGSTMNNTLMNTTLNTTLRNHENSTMNNTFITEAPGGDHVDHSQQGPPGGRGGMFGGESSSPSPDDGTSGERFFREPRPKQDLNAHRVAQAKMDLKMYKRSKNDYAKLSPMELNQGVVPRTMFNATRLGGIGRVELDLGDTDDEITEYEQFYWERKGMAILESGSEPKRARTRAGEPKLPRRRGLLLPGGKVAQSSVQKQTEIVSIDRLKEKKSFHEAQRMRVREREIKHPDRLPLSDGKPRRDLFAQGTVPVMSPNQPDEPPAYRGRRSPRRINATMATASSAYSSAKELPTSPSVERERRRRLLGAERREAERDYGMTGGSDRFVVKVAPADSPDKYPHQSPQKLRKRTAAGGNYAAAGTSTSSVSPAGKGQRGGFLSSPSPDAKRPINVANTTVGTVVTTTTDTTGTSELIDQREAAKGMWSEMYQQGTSTSRRPGFWKKDQTWDATRGMAPPKLMPFRSKGIVEDYERKEEAQAQMFLGGEEV
ncbi:unnamed protein product [Amoebophrya sp. A25]|nr:unnamed protein product [Amoebophrya sp. A25]|eukprot:GSA25T00016321001.1